MRRRFIAPEILRILHVYLLLRLLRQLVEESFSQLQGLGAGAFKAVANDVEEPDSGACFVDLARHGLAICGGRRE